MRIWIVSLYIYMLIKGLPWKPLNRLSPYCLTHYLHFCFQGKITIGVARLVFTQSVSVAEGKTRAS